MDDGKPVKVILRLPKKAREAEDSDAPSGISAPSSDNRPLWALPAKKKQKHSASNGNENPDANSTGAYHAQPIKKRKLASLLDSETSGPGSERPPGELEAKHKGVKKPKASTEKKNGAVQEKGQANQVAVANGKVKLPRGADAELGKAAGSSGQPALPPPVSSPPSRGRPPLARRAQARGLPAKALLEIIAKLQKKDQYHIFAEPVDAQAVPDYYQVIKEPMDFSTMKNKAVAAKYCSWEEFEDDILLICTNAQLYNAPDTVYYQQASRIEEAARRIISNSREERTPSNATLSKLLDPPRPRGRPRKNPLKPPKVPRDPPRNLSPSPAPSASDGWHEDRGFRGSKASGSEGFAGLAKRKEEDGATQKPRLAEAYEDGQGAYGRRQPFETENRRSTYQNSHYASGLKENHTLAPIGYQPAFAYARSLCKFAACLGDVAWKYAALKIEKALPPGTKFGRGWVGEKEAPVSLGPEMVTPKLQQAPPVVTPGRLPGRPDATGGIQAGGPAGYGLPGGNQPGGFVLPGGIMAGTSAPGVNQAGSFALPGGSAATGGIQQGGCAVPGVSQAGPSVSQAGSFALPGGSQARAPAVPGGSQPGPSAVTGVRLAGMPGGSQAGVSGLPGVTSTAGAFQTDTLKQEKRTPGSGSKSPFAVPFDPATSWVAGPSEPAVLEGPQAKTPPPSAPRVPPIHLEQPPLGQSEPTSATSSPGSLLSDRGTMNLGLADLGQLDLASSIVSAMSAGSLTDRHVPASTGLGLFNRETLNLNLSSQRPKKPSSSLGDSAAPSSRPPTALEIPFSNTGSPFASPLPAFDSPFSSQSLASLGLSLGSTPVKAKPEGSPGFGDLGLASGLRENQAEDLLANVGRREKETANTDAQQFWAHMQQQNLMQLEGHTGNQLHPLLQGPSLAFPSPSRAPPKRLPQGPDTGLSLSPLSHPPPRPQLSSPRNADPRPQFIDPRSHPTDPRPHPADPRSHPIGTRPHPAEPRPHPPDLRPQPTEPRPHPTDHRPHPADPTPPPADSRPHSTNPRPHPADPRPPPADSRPHSTDPRPHPTDPRGPPADPTAHPADPRPHSTDPRPHPTDPRPQSLLHHTPQPTDAKPQPVAHRFQAPDAGPQVASAPGAPQPKPEPLALPAVPSSYSTPPQGPLSMPPPQAAPNSQTVPPIATPRPQPAPARPQVAAPRPQAPPVQAAPRAPPMGAPHNPRVTIRQPRPLRPMARPALGPPPRMQRPMGQVPMRPMPQRGPSRVPPPRQQVRPRAPGPNLGLAMMTPRPSGMRPQGNEDVAMMNSTGSWQGLGSTSIGGTGGASASNFAHLGLGLSPLTGSNAGQAGGALAQATEAQSRLEAQGADGGQRGQGAATERSRFGEQGKATVQGQPLSALVHARDSPNLVGPIDMRRETAHSSGHT